MVSINRPRASVWHRTAAKPTAFVYIETEGDRQLPFRVIQSIPEFLVGCEPDLTIGSITVMDRRGHRYLDPGNPSLGDISRKRAREEELSEQILEQLDYIKGVRVEVRVITTPRLPNRRRPGPATSHLDLRPTASSRRSASMAPWSWSPSRRRRHRSPAPVAVAVREGGKVLINVPRSFYFNAMIDKNDSREPSAGRVAPDGSADREADPDPAWTWSFPSPDRGKFWSIRSRMTYHWSDRQS